MGSAPARLFFRRTAPAALAPPSLCRYSRARSAVAGRQPVTAAAEYASGAATASGAPTEHRHPVDQSTPLSSEPLAFSVLAAPATSIGGGREGPVASVAPARPVRHAGDGSERRTAAISLPRWVGGPTLFTALLLAGGLFAASPLQSVAGGVEPAAALQRPVALIALAPLCDVLDALSLLSIRQHVALLVTAIVVQLVRAVLRRPAAQRRWHVAAAREGGRLATLIAAMAAIYAVGAFVPRPMAALALDDPSELAVDFHSHTAYSHDGRASFTVAANRAWHRAAGFDAGYISDHETVRGALEARATNPRRAGDGMMILPAVETGCRGEHLVLLGVAADDTLRQEWGCAAAEAAPSGNAADRPLAIFTLPGRVDAMDSMPALAAAEIFDAAPRALDLPPAEGLQLRHTAARLGIATVASSNNHGLGRTAAAWSVLSVPGWRRMDGPALDRAIRARLVSGGPEAVRVIERRRIGVDTHSALALAVTAPSLAMLIARTMSWPERMVWIGAIWALTALLTAMRRRAA